MGRPPCCDKVGVKKGPWTPEEDIMLVSYVQQHGPGNWRAVPSNTELRRCSKSCRLRWTNYLRPGIRRGSFTDQEEKQIIQLQALLGNKWAAIASYLPERTDNDIKNYWNTHLRKKIKNHQEDHDDHHQQAKVEPSITKGQWEKRLQTDIHKAKRALHEALSLDNTIPIPELNPSSGGNSTYYPYSKPPIQTTSTYVSSTENIARMLKGWMKSCPKDQEQSQSSITDQCSFNNKTDSQSSTEEEETPLIERKSGGIDLSVAFDSLFGFDSGSDFCQGESKPDDTSCGKTSFTMLEEWFLGEVNIHDVKEDLPHLSLDGNAPIF